MHLLRLGLRPWYESPISQLMTLMSLSLVLVLWLATFWFFRNLGPVISRVQSDRQMIVFLAPGSQPTDDLKRVDAIRTQLGAHAIRAESVVYRGVQEFLRDIQTKDQELSSELKALGPDVHQMVPRMVWIRGPKVDRNESFQQAVKGIEGVERIETSETESRQWMSALVRSRKVSQVLLWALIWVAAMVVLHQGRVQRMLGQDSIQVLRMLGAPRWAQHMPRWIHGATLGALAAGVASGTWILLEPFLIQTFKSVSVGTVFREYRTLSLATLGSLVVGMTLLGILFQFPSGRLSRHRG